MWQLEKRLKSERVRAVFPHFEDGGEPVHSILPKDDLIRLQTELKSLVRDVLPAATTDDWWQGIGATFCVVHGDLNAGWCSHCDVSFNVESNT